MKAEVKLENITVHIEGGDPKDLFQKWASAHEVFGETNCGLCGSKNIRPVHRVSGKYHFQEYHCQEEGCRARLSLGVMNDNTGNMFPVRKLTKNGKPSFKDGQYGKHNGWTKFKGDKEESS